MPDLGDAALLDPLSHGTRAAELTSDAAWLQAMVDTELALTRSLVDAGLAPDWMAGVCDHVGDELTDAGRLDLAAIAQAGRGGGNPVIPLVKHLARAAEAVHEGASDHIHVGATSQDILDTAAMVVLRDVSDELQAQLDTLGSTLAALADRHRATVMAGRTLGQQAAPTSFGFIVAGWLDAVLTVAESLRAVRTALPVQLGGAVGNLAVLTEIAAARSARSGQTATDAVAGVRATVAGIVQGVADRLHLANPGLSWHTNRLPITQAAAVLAQATGVVGRLALDVTVLSRTEIAEVTERLGAGEGGSSAMPHKRNPVTAVLVVAAARQAPGVLSTVYGSLLAEDQRPSGAWHAEWQPLRELERHALAAVSAAASLAGRLDVDEERMLANLELTDGLIFSERVTTILAEALGKSAAFELVEQAAAESVQTRRPLKIVLSGLLASHENGGDDALRSRVWGAFDAAGSLGQAHAGIDHALERHRRERQRSFSDRSSTVEEGTRP